MFIRGWFLQGKAILYESFEYFVLESDPVLPSWGHTLEYRENWCLLHGGTTLGLTEEDDPGTNYRLYCSTYTR